MRTAILYTVLFLTFSLYWLPSTYAQQDEAVVTIQNYFSYLKNGNTKGIYNLLTDPLSSDRRKLLENESSYSEFLKNIYKDTNIAIKGIRKFDANKTAVEVEVFSSDKKMVFRGKFILRKENGVWKISEELQDF